jgi:hypothetical protein
MTEMVDKTPDPASCDVAFPIKPERDTFISDWEVERHEFRSQVDDPFDPAWRCREDNQWMGEEESSGSVLVEGAFRWTNALDFDLRGLTSQPTGSSIA